MLNIIIKQVEKPDEIENVKQLFLEYAESLNFDLCFQNFDEELQQLPGRYSPPEGRLLIALNDNKPAGCAALRKHNEHTCEMKRLYVKPEFRHFGLGKILVDKLLDEAKMIGYKKMILDTVPSMESARKIYESIGFKETKPYYYNPQPGTIFMSINLK
jgi:ribosomal protein S18 acetylase RimI-like enzyme